jgi:hypothetical protein
VGQGHTRQNALPNKALEPTPYSFRSFLASAFGRGSPLAFGFLQVRPMDNLPSPPPGWGADPLTAFIDNARLNTFATFANREADFVRLKDIDRLCRDLIGGLTNARELVSNFLLLRTHSSYLAACRLTLSGQVVETFPILRASLESALYALICERRPVETRTLAPP